MGCLTTKPANSSTSATVYGISVGRGIFASRLFSGESEISVGRDSTEAGVDAGIHQFVNQSIDVPNTRNFEIVNFFRTHISFR